MPKNKEDLTPRQKRFADLYIMTGNVTESAIMAGYKESSAQTQGSQQLMKENVAAYIAARTADLQKADDFNSEWVLSRLRRIADNEDAKDADRTRALELLGKYLNLWREQQDPVTQIALVLPGVTSLPVSGADQGQVIEVQAIDWTA